MSDTEVKIANIYEWLDVAFQGVEETASGVLGLEDIKLLKKTSVSPKDAAGAYIALLSQRVSFQLGIVATVEICQALARTLFALEPEDDDLPGSDVADALGEIVNITAGVVKRIISENDNTIQIGLPMFIEGSVTPSDEQELAVADVQLGPHLAHLVVLTPNGSND